MPGPSDQGWSAVEDTLRLAGWDKSRPVVVLRRAAKSDVALTRKSVEDQMELLLPSEDVELWEYAVLVTNSGYSLESMAQLYRERADAENGFDELKNQWGGGGFTTQDIERCQTSARAVALTYNWWSCTAGRPSPRLAWRGHHQPGVVAGCRGQSDQARGEDDALSDADTRGQDKPDATDRQYPSGSQPCKESCGEVPRSRQVEDPVELYRGQNHLA